MTRLISVAGIIVFAMQGAALLAGESQDVQIQALTDKIHQLDKRANQLEDIVLNSNDYK